MKLKRPLLITFFTLFIGALMGCAGKTLAPAADPVVATPRATPPPDFIVPPAGAKPAADPEAVKRQADIEAKMTDLRKQMFLIDTNINEKRAEMQSYRLNPDSNFEFMVQQIEDDIRRLELQRQQLQLEYNAVKRPPEK